MPTPADRIRNTSARRARSERNAITRIFDQPAFVQLDRLAPNAARARVGLPVSFAETPLGDLLGVGYPSREHAAHLEAQRANQRAVTQASLVDDENAARIRRAGIRDELHRALDPVPPTVQRLRRAITSGGVRHGYLAHAVGESSWTVDGHELPSWRSFEAGVLWALARIESSDV